MITVSEGGLQPTALTNSSRAPTHDEPDRIETRYAGGSAVTSEGRVSCYERAERVDVKVAVDVNVDGLRPGEVSRLRRRSCTACGGGAAAPGSGDRLRRGRAMICQSPSLSPAPGVHRHRPKAGLTFTESAPKARARPRPKAVHVHGHVHGHRPARAEGAAPTLVSIPLSLRVSSRRPARAWHLTCLTAVWSVFRARLCGADAC
jgi:hypothetical protein